MRQLRPSILVLAAVATITAFPGGTFHALAQDPAQGPPGGPATPPHPARACLDTDQVLLSLQQAKKQEEIREILDEAQRCDAAALREAGLVKPAQSNARRSSDPRIALQEIALSPFDPGIREEALGRLIDLDAVEAYRDVNRPPSPRQLESFEIRKSRQLLVAVRGTLLDAEAGLRSLAIHGLQSEIRAGAYPVRALRVMALHDPVPELRLSALEALGKRNPKNLLNILKLASRDDDEEVRKLARELKRRAGR